MGLLAPLYALAALAIAAPILFHLIRRQPRGQSEFSSLMFLQASPPRLTRRSRLDNLLLLLLRALALALIALAFARPFLRSIETADAQAVSREILVLLDTSGSMQREDVWKRAVDSASTYVQGLGDTDQVGLATFDSKLMVRVGLPEPGQAASSTPKAQQSAVRSELTKIRPSYRSTALASSLVAAVELLQERASDQPGSTDALREIVLISDLHESSGLEALQGFAWPENVRLDIRRVVSDQTGNARANLMQGTSPSVEDNPTSDDKNPAVDNAVRVRVENNKNSTELEFQLQWLSTDSSPDSSSGSANVVRVQVPPGQARVVPVPYPNSAAERLELSGDHAKHDNIVYVPRTAPRQERVGFVGQKRDKPEEDLFFFLSQVPLSTPVRQVEMQRLSAEQLTTATLDDSLAGLVVEWPLEQITPKMLDEYIKNGKPVVLVLSRPILGEETPAHKLSVEALSTLLGTAEPVSITEADSSDFALWTDIDFRHPLFQPLSDAKYNDFGKVRFWTHRVLKLPSKSVESKDDLRVLARFDDQSPAVIHRRLGRGDLWVMTAGWQSTGSQLALSTKFVPLIFGMLDPRGRSMELDAVYEVGEAIDVPEGVTANITNLDGTPVRDLDETTGMALSQPGLYWLVEDGKRRQIAVTLPLSESQLDPLDLDRFEQYGVVTGKSDSAQERQVAARLSQVQELEGRQKLWRWILVGAIGVLLLETMIAAFKSET
ncbi:MAG: VWA domain-containing protein [Pirellulaceae bacterium]|nr:VWA domain-containing protein [Pirellulaceae bacterium]